jgi:uncharacterized protein YlxW (UPF0749 family)
MIFVAQMKTISNTTEVLQGKREAELIDQISSLKANYDSLKEKYDAKSKIVEEYQNNSATNDTLIKSMKDEIGQLSVMAGTKALKGEGLVITLDDGDKILEPDLRTDSLVHDSDILTVVNELKAAGAEAISVNDQRITANSAIRCVGPVIQINNQKVAAPFAIKAIGNAQYLESALTIKNGVVDSLKNQYGVSVELKRDKNVQIPAYQGTTGYKYAKVNE